MEHLYVIGIDYGTDSVRALLADAESGEWNVTRHAGSMIRVPRRAAMTRTVGGQFPKGFDPVKWGIPASMVGDCLLYTSPSPRD